MRYLKHPKSAIIFGLELIGLVFMAGFWLHLGGGAPGNLALLNHPVPDAAEDAYVTYAFAHGLSPLLPVANQLHPSRFSPVHPALAALNLFLRGGGYDKIQSWSGFAVLAGVLLIYLWLRRGGVGLLWRLSGVALLLFTPLFFWVSQSLMQEPTMFLLFALAVFCWFESQAAAVKESKSAAGYLWGFFCGAACAALFCIRATTAPLGLLLAAAGFCVLPAGRAWRTAAMLAVGGGLLILADVIYIHRAAGMIHVVAYGHWGPDLGLTLFSFSNIFGNALNFSKGSPALLQLREFMGIDTNLTAFGPAASILLVFGGLCELGVWIKHVRRRPVPAVFQTEAVALGIFGASQYILHAMYYFHDIRFYILGWPALVLIGIAGLNDALRLPASAPAMKSSASRGALAVLLVLLLSGFPYYWKTNGEALRGVAGPDKERQEILRQLRAHRANALAAAGLHCPLFVDRLPVVNARLFLRICGKPIPVAALTRVRELYWDGHTYQLSFNTVRPARALLGDASGLWPASPADSWLYDPAEKRLQKDFIRGLLEHYGSLALYFPEWRDKELEPLLEFFKALGCRQIDLSQDSLFRLYLITKNGKA